MIEKQYAKLRGFGSDSKEVPVCPGCGHEMEPCTATKEDGAFKTRYACAHGCGWTAPIGYGATATKAYRNAYELAMKRMVE